MSLTLFDNMERAHRDDLGLIYDIYRIYQDFIKYHRSCQEVDFLYDLRRAADKKIMQGLELNAKFGYLLKLADSLSHDPEAVAAIREKFAWKQEMSGGEIYRRKYYKYKTKYLNLIRFRKFFI